MAIRLYESAWVRIEGNEKPSQVFRDRKNPAAFNVGDYQYDIDGRSLLGAGRAPQIVSLLSMQLVREAGLAMNYDRDVG